MDLGNITWLYNFLFEIFEKNWKLKQFGFENVEKVFVNFEKKFKFLENKYLS